MRQTDNKDMLIRLLSDYYKRIKNIKNYKDFETSADATTRFVDAHVLTMYGEKSNGYLSIDVRDERKRYWNIRLSLFVFWLLLLLITATWLDSNIEYLVKDFLCDLFYYDFSWYRWRVPNSIRHHHSLQIGPKMLLCFIMLTIILKVISVIIRRKEKKYDANRVSLERYQGKVRHIKFMLKDLPWQEVDSVLRKMKDAGVKFPVGYNFKV